VLRVDGIETGFLRFDESTGDARNMWLPPGHVEVGVVVGVVVRCRSIEINRSYVINYYYYLVLLEIVIKYFSSHLCCQRKKLLRIDF